LGDGGEVVDQAIRIIGHGCCSSRPGNDATSGFDLRGTVEVHEWLKLRVRKLRAEAFEQCPTSGRPPDFSVGDDFLPGARGAQCEGLPVAAEGSDGGYRDRDFLSLSDIPANEFSVVFTGALSDAFGDFAHHGYVRV